MNPARRVIAFYLPQFHPIPENDRWWGAGFTEWTNVTRAKPQFPGHYQPHLPADLGFYDLRLPETREAQAALAARYGIHGFCYYHYWFTGKRLLERPFEEVLSSGRPDFPFCLCWANEHWSRRWSGEELDVLVKQRYSQEDDRAHIRSLIPAFSDPRYIRVDGKALFIVYRASHLPDPRSTTQTWREVAKAAGIDLYLARVDNPGDDAVAPEAWGFDAAVEFQPAWTQIGAPRRPSRWSRLLRSMRLGSGTAEERHNIFDYGEIVDRMLARQPPSYKRFPCVTPMWDNTARRREGAYIFHGSTPQLYERWLRSVMTQWQPPSSDENLVFINAWNEWAEGNHLEPDQKWGRAYLEATGRAILGAEMNMGHNVDVGMRAQI